MQDRVGLATVAGHSLDNFMRLAARIGELGEDATAQMQHVQQAFSELRDRTTPHDWHESLMKGYVLDGIMHDVYRAVLTGLDEESRQVATAVLDDTRQAEDLCTRLAAAIAADRSLSSRLALWGRKLVADSMGRGRRLIRRFQAAETQEAEAQILQHAMTNHSRRMSALGLVA
nr:ferritin-like fold-containing protein [Brevibacterium otitidis]